MEEFIRHGAPLFRRTNLAMFAAGVAIFGLLYCVQPLMPEFSRYYGLSAATSSLCLSLTSGLLALAMLIAGVLADAWGRKTMMSISLGSSAVLVLLIAWRLFYLEPLQGVPLATPVRRVGG